MEYLLLDKDADPPEGYSMPSYVGLKPGADWIFAGKRFRETSRTKTQNGPLVQETITLVAADGDPFFYRNAEES